MAGWSVAVVRCTLPKGLAGAARRPPPPCESKLGLSLGAIGRDHNVEVAGGREAGWPVVGGGGPLHTAHGSGWRSS